MKVRKKPVIVDAVQFNPEGRLWHEITFPDGVRKTSYDEVSLLMGTSGCSAKPPCWSWDRMGYLPTLEGANIVSPGDWIITGVKGEKYPCKPDIFKLTYDFSEGIDLITEPKSLLELCRNLIEFARHGDYSNGNVAQGVDEGDVLASQMLEDYEGWLREFESKGEKK